MNIKQLLTKARQTLKDSPTTQLDTEVLLCHVLSFSRAWLYANSSTDVPAEKLDEFQHLLERRQQGEPIAYLTGQREFWSLPLKVTPDVLIPRGRKPSYWWKRPWLVSRQMRSGGSLTWAPAAGAIAIAIASERKLCEVHATENNAAALTIAMENAEAIVPGRIRFHSGSWLSPLQGPFQFIVSNPPYIEMDDPHLQQGDVRYEPVNALSPGHDGLAAIRSIAADSLPLLCRRGWLAFEHGFDQGEGVRKIMEGLGYCDVEILKDFAAKERVTLGRKS